MIDKKFCPVPPRNNSSVAMSLIKKIPHGWEATFTVRRLKREVPSDLGVEGTVLVSVLAHVAFLLRSGGVNLGQLFENISDWQEELE